jgi:hypothetical protein
MLTEPATSSHQNWLVSTHDRMLRYDFQAVLVSGYDFDHGWVASGGGCSCPAMATTDLLAGVAGCRRAAAGRADRWTEPPAGLPFMAALRRTCICRYRRVHRAEGPRTKPGAPQTPLGSPPSARASAQWRDVRFGPSTPIRRPAIPCSYRWRSRFVMPGLPIPLALRRC